MNVHDDVQTPLGAFIEARPRFRFALAAAAVAWFLVQLSILIQLGRLPWPGGDVVAIFDRAGDLLRSGLPVYTHAFDGAFFYAPPIAVLYAAISWLPPELHQLIVLAAEIAALRYIGGSWYGFCLALAFPVMPWELLSGHANLVIGAGIIMAIRGDPRLATATAFLKLSSILAIDPRDWRRAGMVALVAFAITVPWLWLWPAWLNVLAEAYGSSGIGPQIAIPFAFRLAFAVILLALWRPWSRALACVVAIPAFYWSSLVMFIVPSAVVLRGIRDRRNRPHPLHWIGTSGWPVVHKASAKVGELVRTHT